MSVYFIANLRIKDDEEYQKYLDKVREVFDRYKGEYLAVDEHPFKLEGNWDYSRLVLIEFPNRKSLDDWYYSAEYQEIVKHRWAAADCDTIVVTSDQKNN